MASYGFLLRNILLDRFVFRWSIAPSSSVKQWPFRIPDLIKASLTIIIFTSICVCVSGFVFADIRVMLPLLFKLPMLPYLLRPFSTHFLYGSWTIFLPLLHFSLIIRTFFLSLTILSTLEFSELLFDSFVTQVSYICINLCDSCSMNFTAHTRSKNHG
jgi:nucleoporin NDC1